MNNFNRIIFSILLLAFSFNFACAIEQGEVSTDVVVESDVLQDDAQGEVILEPDTLQQEIYEKHKKMFSRKDVYVEKNRESKKEPIVEKSLADKLKKVYKLEVSQTDTPVYLLEDILTYRFKKGIIKDAQLFGAYRGNLNFNFTESDENHTFYDVTAIELGVAGEFKNGWDYKFKTRLAPSDRWSFGQNLISDAYIENDNIKNHALLIGHSKLPIGVEGGQSSSTLLFLNRSQFARTFANSRKLGVRLIGDLDLIDYDFGVYSSDTYFREFFPGVDFTGWIDFKPLGKTKGEYGDLTVGTGLSAGTHHNNYAVGGAYIGYEYKKFLINCEGSIADGYNGQVGLSNKKASGLYTTLGYFVAPKVQLVARYDTFDPNRDVSHDRRNEYSAGINYYLKGQALKFMLNYIFCENVSRADSHRLFFGTQILL